MTYEQVKARVRALVQEIADGDAPGEAVTRDFAVAVTRKALDEIETAED